MIEYIIGGLVVAGLSYLAYRYRNEDIADLELSDAQELYVMVLEFIKGGDDGVIDALDALVLLNKLQKLANTRKRGY